MRFGRRTSKTVPIPAASADSMPASADSSRIVISLRVISRLKKTLAMLLWIDAARQKEGQ